MVTQLEQLDVVKANELLESMDTPDRYEWAIDEFGLGLVALTSAGVYSEITFHQLACASRPVDFMHLDTGFLFSKTHWFLDRLVKKYDVNLYSSRPSQMSIDAIRHTRLWDRDEDLYREITKLRPLSEKVAKLGITALVSGVRRDQTRNREELDFVMVRNDGQIRIHPNLDMSEDEANSYIAGHELERNPLFYDGYGSIDDWTLTKPGNMREGRPDECLINVDR
jgi:phosphoadenosine phosphosulfate reductase